MLRYIDSWINHSKKYEDALGDNFETNDLSLKGSFSFFKNYCQLTGKTNLNKLTDEVQLQTSSNYELELRTTSTNLTVNHQEDEFTSEAEINVWHDQAQKNNLNLYEKSSVKDGKWLLSSQMVYSWNNSYLFNLGFKNLQLFDKEGWCCSSALTSIGIFTKLNQNERLSTWGGVHADLNSKAFQNISFLVGAAYRNLNGVLNFNLDRDNKVDAEITQNDTAACGRKNCSYANSAKLSIESKVNEDFTVYSSAELGSNLWETEVVLGGIYSVDQSTSLRLKLKNDYSGIVSLTKEFKNNFQFTMAAALNYVNKENESKLGYVKTKFGVSLSFVD